MSRTALLLALPAALILLLFVAVLGSFASVSFMVLEPGTAVFHGPASLANYTKLLASEGAWKAVLNTLRLAAEISALCVLAGYPLALLLARSGSRGLRRFILFCLVATFLSGGVTRAYAWLIILGNKGLVNQAAQAIGLPRMALINNEFAVVVSVLNFILPFFVLTLFGALRTIAQPLEHAARNLGASRMRCFLHVTLPLSLPGLAAATSLCFALSLGAFLFPQMLGGGRVQVLATAIYERIQASYDIPAAAALAMLFFVLVLLMLLAVGALRRAASARFAPEAA
ncbi:MAG TPA: ABC transporter permease [Ramlibacter sp.]|uniref:ABC transporter permease n=1 Tax=Ramlibacter sp. TaxID=1917967 RepID=UPI002CF9BC09|nr:ABC transporter permease [Ramlibacter sp.]HVZ45176.1 ABC transporter permease [Ramlibacter sp.]